jgi:hypothetical protein
MTTVLAAAFAGATATAVATQMAPTILELRTALAPDRWQGSA